MPKTLQDLKQTPPKIFADLGGQDADDRAVEVKSVKLAFDQISGTDTGTGKKTRDKKDRNKMGKSDG